jgi:pimeloyl-[acyl-carrier protein] methyl ester esterase
VLVAATPRFVRDASWAHGLARAVVDEFALQLRRDYRELIRRFLALQARGDEKQVALLRQLRAAVFEHGEPDPAALDASLNVLTESDLRNIVGNISVPTLVIAGEYDRLTPPAASSWMAANIRDARLCLLKGAGHAPFLSHADEFLEELLAFLSAEPGRPEHA